jgi:hypothetical protein
MQPRPSHCFWRPIRNAPSTCSSKHCIAVSSPEERERIENAILALGNLEEPRRRWGEHRRDTYLAALHDDAVATEQARTRIDELRAASTLRSGAPMEPMVQGGAMAIDPEQFYAMRGISTEGAANQQLVDLLRPVREFCGLYSRNEDAPDINAALAVMPTLNALDTALRASDASATTDELVHTGYGYLVEAASKIARIPELDAASELGILVQRFLDDGVTAHWPAEGADDEHYDGGWSSLPGRIEAVEGLFSLFANPGFDAQHILAMACASSIRTVCPSSVFRSPGDFCSSVTVLLGRCGS